MMQSLPGIFEETIFDSKRRFVSRSVFIKAMHPTTEISPTPASIERILKAGWVGQMKIHGHRAQIHLHPKEEPIAYNRQGQVHTKLLPKEIIQELRRIFVLKSGWTVIDTEWLKPEDKLFIFDILKMNDKLLRNLNYQDRFKLLPKLFISPHVQRLPLITTMEECLDVMARPEKYIEGLVFKSLTTKGFEDTSIVRCRKRSV